jgi:CHAT domain-containing protein
MAPETRLIKKVFCEFNAHVGLDFHEYRPYRKDFAQLSDFGITSAYDTMFLYSGNLNVPENIRNYTNDVFVQNARKLMDFKNFRHREYTSTGKYAGEIHFTQGSSNARSSATNYALNNMISTLFEVRGVGLGKTSFKRRIEITLELALSYTKTAVENTTAIKNEIQKAILDSKPVVVTSKRKVYKDTIKAIDLDTESLIDLDVTIRDALQSSPVLERLKPNAYIIEASQIAILNKLKNLGIEMIPLIEDKLFTVEAYRISSYNEASKVYEKMKLQKVKTEVTTIQKEFPVGTLLISMQQQRSNLLTEVLEPEAPNSFVSFGVLKTKLDDTLPIYRVINK